MRLVITVHEVKGQCAAYRGGERIVIDDFVVNTKESDRICIHGFAPVLHYLTALKEGVSPVKLGLSKKDGEAYIRCPDCGEPYTPGGGVVFRIRIEP